MIDGQSERQKKAMKIHEIVSSDKNEFAECKHDLMTKIAMSGSDADEVASSIRDMYLPKLLHSVGLDERDIPFDFDVKMTDNDEDFEEDMTNDNAINYGNEFNNDDNEVDDELATIHITVPADKIRDVEKALETALGDTDAISEDSAIDHKDKDTGEDMNNNKELEARAALRKTILAAASDDDEVKSVSRKDKFDYDKSEQYREEGFYNTKKGDMNDPEHTTLDFKENKIPNFTQLVDDHLSPDLGLHDTLTVTKFDGSPDNDDELGNYTLDFDEFEVPSQGDKELFNEFGFPSENKQPHKHTIISSAKLGNFDPDTAEEVLAFALKTAGVEDEDLGKLTYAQGLELYKAIKTAETMEREHYGKDGKMVDDFNDPKSPDKKAVTEDSLRDHVGSEEDPEEDHERKGRELYSSTDAYAELLRKLMRTSEKDTYNDYPDHGFTKDSEPKEKGERKGEGEVEMEMPESLPVKSSNSEESVKSAELEKARIKTAYAMSSKLVTAGLLPASELDTYAENLLEDGLTVKAMFRQTQLMINSAASNAERLSASNASKSVRTASTGFAFNPSVRGGVDLAGANDLRYALKNIGWTAPRVDTGMED